MYNYFRSVTEDCPKKEKIDQSAQEQKLGYRANFYSNFVPENENEWRRRFKRR